MLESLEKRRESEGWTGVETRFVDGKELETSVQEEGFSHAFVGFAIFVLPPDTIKNLAGKLKSGGALGVSTWARMPWYEIPERTSERMKNRPELPSREVVWASFTNGKPWNEKEFVKSQLEEVELKKVEIVQREFKVDCGSPDIFVTTTGFVLGMLSRLWVEEFQGKWLKECQETMKVIFVKEAGGADQPVFMTCEGMVGLGWKE